MKKAFILIPILFIFCSAFTQWSTSGSDVYTSNSSSNVGLGATATERLSVGGNIYIPFNNNYLQLSDRLTLQVPGAAANDWTRSIIGHNVRWNPSTSMWRVDGGTYSDFSLIRFENGANIGFYVRNATGSSYEMSDNDMKAYKRMVILNNGNVGIGTDNPGSFRLAVEGKIGAREVKVTLQSWADYVFNKNYQLRSLSSLEKYIQQNNRLPGMPSTREVMENGGIDLGVMNTKLLEKVEELTLYVIELKKEIEALKKNR